MKKVEGYSGRVEGTIMLNANELSFDMAQNYMDEIIAGLKELSFNRYPDTTNQRVIDAYASAMNLDANMILAGNGSDEMLGFLIGSFLGKDKTLYTLAPDFSMYDYYCGMHDASIAKFACAKDGSWNVDAFIAQGKEIQPHMILFSNPNNPSGYAMDCASLCKLLTAFPNIPVIIDEAYGEFNDESMLAYLDQYPNLYVTRTLSKAYGLAGARIGFLISNVDNMERLRPQVVPYNVNSFTQMLASVVLKHHQDYACQIEAVKQMRDTMYERLKGLQNITIYPSKANYLFGRCANKEKMLAAFEAEGIVIRNYGDDSFRITIGLATENEKVCSILETIG